MIILMFEVLNDAGVDLSLGRLEVSEKGSLSTVVFCVFFGERNFAGYITLPSFSRSFHIPLLFVSNLGVLLLGASPYFFDLAFTIGIYPSPARTPFSSSSDVYFPSDG